MAKISDIFDPMLPRKQLSSLRTLLTWQYIRMFLRYALLLGVLLVFTFTLFAAYVSRNLPNPDTLISRPIEQSTKIFDRTGKVLLYEIHGDEKRTLITINDIPDFAQKATISVEDKGFYEHHGIYWKGLFRAVLKNTLLGRRIQGTSTLTQQLIKNAVLNNERSLLRKVKEFILAIQIERVYTKEQILQMYFNEIPYGSTVYGIESAAQTYFGKPAKDLTLDEATLLAAIPQAPDFYNPYGTSSRGDNRPALIARQHMILDLMAEQKYITEDQASAAKKVDVLKKLQPRKLGNIRAPHFVMYVKQQLEKTYGVQTVETGGLRVITTLDWDKQQAAEDAVRHGVEAKGKKYNFTNAALVSIDPKTGQVLAMVGSKDYFDTEHDGQVNVALRPRQPGSSFKPIVYSLAFSLGYLPQTQVWDVQTVFKTDTQPYEPHDYDGKERGPLTLRQALQGSLNIPAVKMLYLVGVGKTLDYAETLGYTTLGDRSRFGLSLVLGGAEVTPLEHASTYATFANEGTRLPTSSILRVEDSTGVAKEEWKPSTGTSVLDPNVARTLSNVLSDNDARTYVFGAQNALTLPDRPVAAKTGTTNNYHDAWTAGYTPNLAAVVWVGNNNNKEMTKGADGSVVAAPIWQEYMKQATKKMPIEPFTTPTVTTTTSNPGILGTAIEQPVAIDRVSGKRATSLTPPELIEYVPHREAHSILQYIDKDDPTGPAPANPADDPQYVNWEAGVQAWVEKTHWNATGTVPLTYDDVHTADVQPVVTITSPVDGFTVSEPTLDINYQTSSTYPILNTTVTVGGFAAQVLSQDAGHVRIQLPTNVGGNQLVILTAQDSMLNRGSASVRVIFPGEQTSAPVTTSSTTSTVL